MLKFVQQLFSMNGSDICLWLSTFYLEQESLPCDCNPFSQSSETKQPQPLDVNRSRIA